MYVVIVMVQILAMVSNDVLAGVLSPLDIMNGQFFLPIQANSSSSCSAEAKTAKIMIGHPGWSPGLRNSLKYGDILSVCLQKRDWMCGLSVSSGDSNCNSWIYVSGRVERTSGSGVVWRPEEVQEPTPQVGHPEVIQEEKGGEMESGERRFKDSEESMDTEEEDVGEKVNERQQTEVDEELEDGIGEQSETRKESVDGLQENEDNEDGVKQKNEDLNETEDNEKEGKDEAIKLVEHDEEGTNKKSEQQTEVLSEIEDYHEQGDEVVRLIDENKMEEDAEMRNSEDLKNTKNDEAKREDAASLGDEIEHAVGLGDHFEKNGNENKTEISIEEQPVPAELGQDGIEPTRN